jgi:hypothetical protein
MSLNQCLLRYSLLYASLKERAATAPMAQAFP